MKTLGLVRCGRPFGRPSGGYRLADCVAGVSPWVISM